MLKAVMVMFIGTIVGSIGDGFLSKGLRELQQLEWTGGGGTVMVQYVWAAVHKPSILIGVLCQVIFFGTILVAFSWEDLSLVLPITAFGYVFAPVIAHYFLNEDVNILRWAGALIIVIGVFTVLLGERAGADLSKGKMPSTELVGHLDVNRAGANNNQQGQAQSLSKIQDGTQK